jgi:outer membrane protein assembly factor BamB
MRRHKARLLAGLGFAVFVPAVFAAAAATAPPDWPRYRGPKGDGVSKETGLLKAWPASGPRVLWRAKLGTGYSGMAVVGSRLFTMFGSGGNEYAAAFDATSGKELWRTRTDRDRPDGQGGGPRATPTVDGNLVYVLGAEGALAALDAASGKARWSVDLVAQHGARVPDWGVSTSPVVEGNLLLVNAGGSNGRSLLGLDKATGKLVWASESDVPGYSTPLVLDLAGTRQAIFFAGSSLISVAPQTGKKYWSVPWQTSYDVNAAMPVFVPPDKIFISSSYDTGGQLLRVVAKGGGPAAETVWRNRVMKNHFNTSVYVAGHLYGFDDATLKCIEPQSAAECWKQRGFGKGSLLVADGHLWVLSDDGELALVEVAPGGYREKARARVLQGKTWTMPTLAGKRLYVRSESELVALDVAG